MWAENQTFYFILNIQNISHILPTLQKWPSRFLVSRDALHQRQGVANPIRLQRRQGRGHDCLKHI